MIQMFDGQCPPQDFRVTDLIGKYVFTWLPGTSKTCLADLSLPYRVDDTRKVLLKISPLIVDDLIPLGRATLSTVGLICDNEDEAYSIHQVLKQHRWGIQKLRQQTEAQVREVAANAA